MRALLLVHTTLLLCCTACDRHSDRFNSLSLLTSDALQASSVNATGLMAIASRMGTAYVVPLALLTRSPSARPSTGK